MWAATANPQIGAVVSFYYVMPHGKPDFTKLNAPVLGHFGTNDDFISQDDAESLEAELQQAGVEAAFEFYEGAGHAFSRTTTGSAPTTRSTPTTPGARRLDFYNKHLSRNDRASQNGN